VSDAQTGCEGYWNDVPPLGYSVQRRSEGSRVGSLLEIQDRVDRPRPRRRSRARTPKPPGRPLRVLIADDDADVRETLAGLVLGDSLLDLAGLAVDAKQAVEIARRTRPDVALIDINMPGGGDRAAEEIRWRSPRTRLIAFSFHDDRGSILRMLRAGATGYVVKGASFDEILDALHRAAEGRPHFPLDVVRELASEGAPDVPASSSVRRLGELVLDLDAREVYVAGGKVELTRIEFDLLKALSARPRMVFTRSKLLELIWGPTWFGDDHVVEVHISSLRRKIGDDPITPRYIRTVRGVGYRIGDANVGRPDPFTAAPGAAPDRSSWS
jgi:DNA-binding response OmpR family regulator